MGALNHARQLKARNSTRTAGPRDSSGPSASKTDAAPAGAPSAPAGAAKQAEQPSPAAAGISAAEISRRLDAAWWISKDDEARKIVGSLTIAQIEQLPPETRQRLKNELNAGWVGDEDKAALKKVWQAEHKASVERALEDQRAMLEARKADLARWNDADEAEFKKWFGNDDEASRKVIQDRIDRELELNKKTTIENFQLSEPPKANRYAYVYPGDENHTIYLDGAFDRAPATGPDSKAGTLVHEMSHFSDVGGTKDHVYGQAPSKALATADAGKGLTNADSFEYHVEKAP